MGAVEKKMGIRNAEKRSKGIKKKRAIFFYYIYE
jgi:hypothetical protein